VRDGQSVCRERVPLQKFRLTLSISAGDAWVVVKLPPK
jgi:hypothetical protein